MSSQYRIGDQRHAHFVTFTVIHWLDFFIREEYRNAFVKSIQYCQQHKGLEVYGYCIMTSHVHIILRAGEKTMLEDIIRDLKSHTSRCFHDMLTDERNNYESRKKWMLELMKDHLTGKFQFWQHGYHPIELWSDEFFYQKMDYIHLNPVASGFVAQPEHWYYSSARDYAGLRGPITLVNN
jgi:putative transposase